MSESCINEEEIRKTIAIFKPDGELFEVRIHGGKRTISGYFREADTLIRELQRMEALDNLNGANVFYTINGLKDECEGRLQNNQFLQANTTTSDNDVDVYDWLLIDLDPDRPKDTSSTDEQLQKARECAGMVYLFLKNRGFAEPIISCSGNGYHLQYKIGLLNTEENRKLVKDTLASLDILFSNEEIKIDRAVFNPSRICKLYGTRAQKGASTKKQPHRMSRIIYVPEEVKQVSAAYLKELVDEALPKEQPKMRYNHYNPKEFDLEEWLDRYGIRYRKQSSGDYEKFILEECPFNSEHKAPDSMVTRGRNGALGFKCLHSSCASYKWQDFRLFFEPDSYDSKDDGHIDAGYESRKQNRDIDLPIDQIADFDGQIDEQKLDAPVYMTAKMILAKPKETNDFIKTGITAIDKQMAGLIRGGISVLSGLRGGSKSTLTTQISLNVIQDGGSVLFHSFEMKDKTVMRWFNLMAAGKANVRQDNRYENYYFVTDPVEQQIAEWLGDRLWIYNNDFGNNYEKLYHELVKEIKATSPDLIILDNLMALNLSGIERSGDQYREQTIFVNSLVTLAKQSNTHIIFVAHPRKANGFLRLDDISGSANIGNAVNNAFIVHRNNADFQRLTGDMFHWKSDHPAYSGTNVIEIAKDREFGTQDYFVPLWYEPETKRLKNTQAEALHYGWEGFVDATQATLDDLPFNKEGA